MFYNMGSELLWAFSAQTHVPVLHRQVRLRTVYPVLTDCSSAIARDHIMTLGSSICEGKLVNLPISSRMCTLCYHCLHCSVMICQCQGHTISVGPCLALLPPPLPPQVLLPPTAGHPITGVNTIVGQGYEMITGFSQKQL